MLRVSQGRLRGGGYARPNIQELEPTEDQNFSGNYLRNRSTLDIGVLGYIGIV